MATRGFHILKDRPSLTAEDYDQQLKYIGASVLVYEVRTASKMQLARMVYGRPKEPVENILYSSGSGSASEADEAGQNLGIEPVYESPVSCIVMTTGYGTVEKAVEAIKSGAYDYLMKPFSADELTLVVKRALANRLLKLLKECLDDSISVLDAALNAYDEEVERETYLNVLKEKVEDLWEHRNKYNTHFLDVVVQLKVVSRILDYQVLSKTQIESIKEVFSLLKKIDITKTDRLRCWKMLEESGIDLNAPIKGYENFELVLREKQHRK